MRTLVFILFFMSLDCHALTTTITLGVTQETIDSKKGKFLKKLYTEIYQKLNYKLKIKILPPIRLAIETKAGRLDGELVRMSRYGKSRPYLTRIEEPHFRFSLAIYTYQKRFKFTDWIVLKVM